uniref:Uncharacterized protein n=1 Tax=Romanomermis culicivorax TaxID=13658 RepID=A0A915KV31_ROMCU
RKSAARPAIFYILLILYLWRRPAQIQRPPPGPGFTTKLQVLRVLRVSNSRTNQISCVNLGVISIKRDTHVDGRRRTLTLIALHQA